MPIDYNVSREEIAKRYSAGDITKETFETLNEALDMEDTKSASDATMPNIPVLESPKTVASNIIGTTPAESKTDYLPSVSPIKPSVPSENESIVNVFKSATQPTTDLMKQYGMDTSGVEGLGDLGVGSMLQSEDALVGATKEYVDAMKSSMEDRRSILEEGPEANWMILIAAALLPKQKAAGLVTGYYDGIMKRFDRESERKLAIQEDSLKILKLDLDLAQTKTSADKSKLEWKQRALKFATTSLADHQKSVALGNSASVTRTVAHFLNSSMKNGIPDNQSIDQVLKGFGVTEEDMLVARTAVVEQLGKETIDFRAKAAVSALNAASRGSGTEATNLPSVGTSPKLGDVVDRQADVQNNFNTKVSQIKPINFPTFGNTELTTNAKDLMEKVKSLPDTKYGWQEPILATYTGENEENLNTVVDLAKQVAPSFMTALLTDTDKIVKESSRWLIDISIQKKKYETVRTTLFDAVYRGMYGEGLILTGDEKTKVDATLMDSYKALDALVLSSSNNPDADLTNRAYVKFAVTDAIKKSVYAATGKEPINPKVNISDTIMDSFQNSMLEYKANVTSFRNLFTNHILPTVQLYASNVLSTVSDSSDTATRDKTASLLAWVMLAETVPDNPTLLWDVVKGQQTQIQTQIVPPPVAEKVTFVTVEKAIKNIPTVEDFVNLLGESKDTRMEKINRIKANSTEVKRLLGNPEKKDTNGNTHSKLAGDIVTTELYPDFIKYLSIAFPNTSFNENENLRLIGMLVSNFAISNKQ